MWSAVGIVDAEYGLLYCCCFADVVVALVVVYACVGECACTTVVFWLQIAVHSCEQTSSLGGREPNRRCTSGWLVVSARLINATLDLKEDFDPL